MHDVQQGWPGRDFAHLSDGEAGMLVNRNQDRRRHIAVIQRAVSMEAVRYVRIYLQVISQELVAVALQFRPELARQLHRADSRRVDLRQLAAVKFGVVGDVHVSAEVTVNNRFDRRRTGHILVRDVVDSPCADSDWLRRLNEIAHRVGDLAVDDTDVMAAIGMCQASARFGMSAYLGKAGISQHDREDAAKALALYAHKTAPTLLSKAANRKMGQCMVVLAKFAYDDYARSAADTTKCPHCRGRGVTNTLAQVMTHPGCGEKTPPTYQLQLVENQCVTCHGKGKLSARCR